MKANMWAAAYDVHVLWELDGTAAWRHFVQNTKKFSVPVLSPTCFVGHWNETRLVIIRTEVDRWVQNYKLDTVCAHQPVRIQVWTRGRPTWGGTLPDLNTFARKSNIWGWGHWFLRRSGLSAPPVLLLQVSLVGRPFGNSRTYCFSNSSSSMGCQNAISTAEHKLPFLNWICCHFRLKRIFILVNHQWRFHATRVSGGFWKRQKSICARWSRWHGL